MLSMISTGSRVTVIRNIQDSNGMLYSGTKVKIVNITDTHIQVSDSAGRLFWVKSTDISV